MTRTAVAPADERLLVLAPTGRDGPLTCALLGKAGFSCHVCADMNELCDCLEKEGAAALVIAVEVLGRSAAARLFDLLSRQPSWSDIPIIVFTGETSHASLGPLLVQWLDRLGNVTLLDRPVRPITMVSAVKAALRARHRQYQAREELLRQERAVSARDQFLAMLGHELRNPLSAILMAIELIDRSSAEEAQRPRTIVRRQLGHLSRLVDDLLDVARVTTGKIVLQRAPVELNDLVERCVQSILAQAGAQRLEITFQRAPRPVSVDGDPVRLEQILANLMTNAVKYTPAGGHVDVSLQSREGFAVLRLADDGVGIAPDMLPRIFDLFAQAEGTLDRAKGGMGIGLTLVRSLIELHGGSIQAASPGLGQGSVFTVRLPLRAAAQSSAPRDEEADLAAASVSHSVLLVEDNDDSRELLQSFLAGVGHRVTAVADGLSGVERAVTSRPDVLIVDIGLPGLDGYGVARKVREVLGDGAFLIALTGYGQPEDRRLALEAGFDLHFTKPVDLQGMKRLLGRSALRAQDAGSRAPLP
jgi:signal transduction histidine kinase/CheY-like chemotaxis protein